MNIVGMPSDETACSWQRLYLPLHFVRKQGLADVTFAWKREEELCSQADVVIYQRHYQQEPLSWWRTLVSWRQTRERWPILVWEMDDDVWAIPASNPFKRFYTKEVIAAIDEMVATADLITVPSAGLAAVLKSKTKAPVVILPSGMDPQALSLQRTAHDDGLVRIGYAASDTHHEDLEQCANALRRVLVKRKHVRLILQGVIAKGCLDNLPQDQVIRQPWMPFGSGYYPHLASLGVDIWIAPLKPMRFNFGKASVKVLEAAMLKTPIICSPVGVYTEVVKRGVTGLFASTPAGWEDALLQLIDDAGARRQMGAAAFEAVSQFTYDQLARQWVAAYQQRLEEVHGRHQTDPGVVRVPELSAQSA